MQYVFHLCINGAVVEVLAPVHKTLNVAIVHQGCS